MVSPITQKDGVDNAKVRPFPFEGPLLACDPIPTATQHGAIASTIRLTFLAPFSF